MQFESFHWLSHHGIWTIIPWSTKMQSVGVIFFWSFCFYCSPSFLYFGGVFNKTIIPLALVGYEMIIANLALRTSLAIYHLISNVRSWNNCQIAHVRENPLTHRKGNIGGGINNYSPKWRWLLVDIYRAMKQRGKYPTLATNTEVNSWFSIY